jgi:hypothetical protein
LWPRPYLELLLAKGQARYAQSSSEPKRRRRQYLAKLVTPWVYLRDTKEVERVVPVYINPYLPLPRLLKAIGELLLRDYPHLLASGVKLGAKAAFEDLLQREDPQSFREWALEERRLRRRGRGSVAEQCQVDLKALSSWRLTKRFGYTARSAIDLLNARQLITYRDVRSFRRGVRRAAQKITALEAELHRFGALSTQGVTA